MNARSLKTLRIALGFTQEEMAVLLCRSVSAVKRFETGRRAVDLQTEALLVALLEDPRLRQRLEGAHYSPTWTETGPGDLVSRVLASRPQRCLDCGVLIGPGHVEASAQGGRCSSCAKVAAETPAGRTEKGRWPSLVSISTR